MIIRIMMLYAITSWNLFRYGFLCDRELMELWKSYSTTNYSLTCFINRTRRIIYVGWHIAWKNELENDSCQPQVKEICKEGLGLYILWFELPQVLQAINARHITFVSFSIKWCHSVCRAGGTSPTGHSHILGYQYY